MSGNPFTSRQLAASTLACSIFIMFNSTTASAGNYPPLETVINQGLSTSPPGFPGLYWNLSGGLSAPLIDTTGKITFAGRIFGDGITTLNNRVVWHGTGGNWSILARSSETLPGLPGGVTLLVPSESGLNLSANGKVFVSSTLQGTGVATTNDTAFWYGAPGSLLLGAREGSPITTGGALINSAMTLTTRVNNAGQVLIPTNLTGGDTVTTNNSGLFLYGPSGFTTVWRKGDPIPGAPALPATDGPFMTPSLFTLSMNSSGAVAYTGTLVAGTAGGVATTNDAVMVVTDGNGVTRIIARESDSYLPLCNAGADPKDPLDDVVVRYRQTSSFTPATRSINNGGKTLFNAMIEGVNGAHGVTTANDSLWLLDTGSGDPQIVLREGQSLTGLTFNLVNFQAIMINNNDRMAFAGTASDGTQNLSCLWTGPAGGPYTMIVKQGDLLPGSTDANINFNISSASLTFNNADQIIFSSDLTGPGVTTSNSRAILGWDPVQGLIVIARTGVTTLPGVLDLSLLSLPGTTYQSGDSGCSYFTDNGWLTFRVQDLKGFNAIVRCRPFDPINACPADTDDNGSVDVTDLLAIIAAWGATGTNTADINGDLVVDVTDLLAVIADWGACP